MTVSTKDKILQMVKDDPQIRNKDIAAAVGCSRPYVSAILQRNGFTSRAKPRLQPNPKYMRKTASLTPENVLWAQKQAEQNNVSLSEFVDACLTDARLDDEERARE